MNVKNMYTYTHVCKLWLYLLKDKYKQENKSINFRIRISSKVKTFNCCSHNSYYKNKMELIKQNNKIDKTEGYMEENSALKKFMFVNTCKKDDVS